MINILYINLNTLKIEFKFIENEKSLNIEKDDLVFKAPILCGYNIIGLNRLTVSSEEHKSQCGGHFAHFMKCSGYDYIVIKGKSKEPIYIYIDKEKIYKNNSVDLNNKNYLEFEKIIKDKLKEEELEIALIGRSGENKIDFSKILFSHSKSCGKNYLGKIMGEKNLKAIILKRYNSLNPFDEKELYRINNKISSKISNQNINSHFDINNNCYGCNLNCESSVISKIQKLGFNLEIANTINKLCDVNGMDSIIFSNIAKEYFSRTNISIKELSYFTDDFINNYEKYKYLYDNLEKGNKYKDKKTKEKNKANNELENLGFCKFLINKEILSIKDLDLLKKYTLGL